MKRNGGATYHKIGAQAQRGIQRVLPRKCDCTPSMLTLKKSAILMQTSGPPRQLRRRLRVRRMGMIKRSCVKDCANISIWRWDTVNGAPTSRKGASERSHTNPIASSWYLPNEKYVRETGSGLGVGQDCAHERIHPRAYFYRASSLACCHDAGVCSKENKIGHPERPRMHDILTLPAPTCVTPERPPSLSARDSA